MTPEEAREKAENNFLNGCNCTQAVVKVFSDELKLDSALILKAAQPLGGGLCRQRELCGTVSGMLMSLGLYEGTDDTSDKNTKDTLYSHGQFLTKEFSQKNGSIICRELLGLKKGENSSPVSTERTPDFYQKRPCKKYCGDAAAILAKYLSDKNNSN